MMQHAADKILRIIMDADDWMQDIEIASKANLTKDETDKWLIEIQKFKPGWIRIRKGLDETDLRVIFIADDNGELDNFFLYGGFTKMLTEQGNIEKQEDEMKALQKENLVTTTRAAEESIKRAKRAEVIAIVAALVSLIALLLELKLW
jgi:hypothetical protein